MDAKIKVDFLSKDEERELTRRALEGDTDARNRVVMNVYPWIIRKAHKYSTRTPYEDLVQHAVAACVEKFHLIDLSFKSRPMTYLTNVAERQMQRLTKIDGVITRPVDPNDKRRKLTQETKDAAERASLIKSLSAQIVGEKKSIPLANLIVDTKTPMPEDKAEANESDTRFQAMLDQLPDARWRKVLQLRIASEMKLEQIGRILGITKERVRQLEAKALEFLKDPAAGMARRDRKPAASVEPNYRRAPCGYCGETFTKKSRKQTFCSRRCAARHSMFRRREPALCAG